MTTVKPTTPRRKPGRPPGSSRAKKPAAASFPDDPNATPEEREEMAKGLDLGVVYGGVSAHWLSNVFGMDKNTVKKKLSASCTIVGMNKGTPLYTIKEAASYLVPPKVDIDAYMRGLRYNDLPPMLQAAYWDGQLKRQKWQVNAGELWHTTQVLDVLGELAKTVKTTIQLWPDQVQGLSDKQRIELQERTDSLLNSIHHIFVTAPQEGFTPSSMEEQNQEASEDMDLV